ELFKTVKAFHACKQEEGQSNYDQFIQNYNMHSIGKTTAELHAMLKLHEKGIPKKAETPTEVGHWRRNYPSYLAELKKRKNASRASTLGIFTLELYAFPNKTWVYDMGCGTHICITSQGLKESKKLKHEALSLLMVQEASGSRGLLESSGSDGGLELIQEKDIQPSENSSEIHNEVVPTEVEPQNVKVPIRRSTKIPQAPDRYGFYVDVEKHELGDLNEPPNYKGALLDPKFDKWLEAMNMEMQSMKDNEV
ncbi:hypothetical protein Tco_1084410, partial [Tanacetum coccineum]